MCFRLFAVVVLATSAISGCNDVPRSRIHGVVKFQGKPLTNASIIFIASDNKTYLTSLKEDGSFELSGVAQGLVKVSIQQSLPKVAPRPDPTSSAGSKAGVVDEKARATRPPAPAAKDNGPRLPELYTDPEKSGLSFELKELDQEWSVDLK
jgi:hypothetical protein